MTFDYNVGEHGIDGVWNVLESNQNLQITANTVKTFFVKAKNAIMGFVADLMPRADYGYGLAAVAA